MGARPGAKTVANLESKQAELRAQLAQAGDLRPGSLVERYRRCGKAGCHCAAEGARGHGPSWSLTHAVAGKTVTKVIPPGAVAKTRQQLEEYRKFRSVVREFIDTGERLCDARLRESLVTSEEAAKKGASKRPSPPRSSPR